MVAIIPSEPRPRQYGGIPSFLFRVPVVVAATAAAAAAS